MALRKLMSSRNAVSGDYRILERPPTESLDIKGWQHPDVAKLQDESFVVLLQEMEAGRPRADFVALAEAVKAAAVNHPSIVELGCGSGWNWQVLHRLYGRAFDYMGLDCSAAMIEIAQRKYSAGRFLVGDAMSTPFADESCDILISGTVLMHLPDFNRAIRECRRLARQWCVFHTVPVLQRRATTFLCKRAYGEPTVEVIFNEDELKRAFECAGLVLHGTWESLDYNLKHVLGESTRTRTYLCAAKR